MITEERKRVRLLPVDHPLNRAVIGTPRQDAVQFFREHFGRNAAVLTNNGRAAIAAILDSLNLRRSDEICIMTTFDLPNVSSCVTSTVFNYCKPSRVMSQATRAVVVIHEFGVPYRDMEGLAKECQKREIQLIEDCAHTINSTHENQLVGKHGDWIVCSLPKIFPVRLGGVLLGDRLDEELNSEYTRNSVEAGRDVEPFLNELAILSVLRRAAYRSLSEYANRVGLHPVFEVTDEITPWFFPLRVSCAPRVMDAALNGDIECGRWHGTNIVVFPCHQNLAPDDLSRIGAVFETGG